jgi:hypothetical protein
MRTRIAGIEEAAVVFVALAGAFLFAAWAAAWLTRPRAAAAAPSGAGDPYADEVARFRREVHDWDRRGWIT